MSNAWIDDDFFRRPWVRACGQVGTLAYLAATNIIHRDIRNIPRVSRLELLDELPWDISESEIESAFDRLVERGVFHLDGDGFYVPVYFMDQEDNAKRTDRKAQAKRAADERWRAERERVDAQRMLTACSAHADRNASYPVLSGPVLSDPSISPPPSASAAMRKKPTGDHAEILALWQELWIAATNSKPTLGAAAGKAVKVALAAHGRATIEVRMRRCFAEHVPAFVWSDGPPSITTFFSATIFDKLASVGPAPVNGKANGYVAPALENTPFNDVFGKHE